MTKTGDKSVGEFLLVYDIAHERMDLAVYEPVFVTFLF